MFIKNVKKNFFIYQLPAIFWTIMTYILSSTSKFAAPDLDFAFQDKLHHLIYYTVYGYLLSMAFYKQEKFLFLKRNFVVSTIIIGSMYGLSDEFHQYFVEGRTMDFWDWIADSIGVTLGAFFFSNNNILIQKFTKYFKSTKKK